MTETDPGRMKVRPETARLSCTVRFMEPEETEDGKKKVRFKGIANSGKPFQHWFWRNFAVNLQNMAVNKDSLPVLLDHWPDQRVGYTTRIEVTKNGVEVEGVILNSTPFGQEFMETSEEGFPWQMSVAVPPEKIIKLDHGEKTTVNGHEFVGPGHIFEKSTLREVTVTSLGADEQTDATLLSLSGDVHADISAAEEESMSEQMDIATLRAKHPDVADRLAQDAQKAERDRITGIQAKAKGVPQELVQQCITEGLSADQAASKILEHFQSEKADRLSQLTKGNEEPVGSEDPESDEVKDTFTEGKKKPKDKLSDMPEGPEKWKKEFATDPKVREEFGDEEVYLAFREHEGDARILTRKEGD